MKTMLKKMMLGAALLLAGAVGAAGSGTLVTFSSTGPDAYPDGVTVVDGEYYALAWAEEAAKLVMDTDGTMAEGRVLAKVAVAEGKRCPPVNVKLDDAIANACQGGVWGVFLFDTRGSTGGNLTISSATLIADATVEIASNGFLRHARLRSGSPIITEGVTDDPAASIATTGYATLADAIAAAADSGDTIRLMKNVTEDIAIGKSLVFDGAGHKLTGTVAINSGAAVAITNATFDAAGGNLYAFDIKGGAQVMMTDVTVGGGIWCNVHLNGGSLSGSGITMVGDVVEVSADGSYYTYRGQTVTGAPPFGMDFTNVKGESVAVPFMDIVRETGAETVSLAEPLVRGASLLFVANMPGDGTQTGVTIPSPRFGCYTLDISAPISFLDGETTGWTETTWNEIVDTGSLVLESIGEDSGTVAVELTLNEDIDLGSNEFEFRNANLTVDGDGNALSGTIRYTDSAGVMENIVLGTDSDALMLDMTGVTKPIVIGSGVAVTNVTIKMRPEQATHGTQIVTWNAEGGVSAPANEEGVSIMLVDAQGAPTGGTATLVWDDARGVAYIRQNEARLSGPSHAAPIDTLLTEAIALAADSGDTITLLIDVTADVAIGKSLVFDGAGHKLTGTVAINSGAAVAITNATFDAAGGNLYAFDIKGGAQVTMTDVMVGGGIWCNVHLNGGNLSGSGITMVGDVVEVSADGSYYTYRGQTVTGAPPFGMDFENVKGESVTIPFMDIVRETGAETVSLAEPLVRGASLLFVANMPGDGTQTGVTVPSPRFGCYTLDISAPISFLDGETTGWTETTWNDIIDTGSLVLEAVGEDSGTVAVGLTLNEDINLGANEFEFRNGNLTVDGDGNALSGTIKYTDTAGLLENIVLGTDSDALMLDMIGVTKPIVIGSGVAVTNVTIKMTEAQATAGTPVVIWDVDGGVDAPENEEGVTVELLNDQGVPIGNTAELIWDDAMGMAYIGPCEARLTGLTHDKPVYTTLANAIALAADSGDTITLLIDVTADVAIGKSLVFDGAGHKLTGTVAINSGAAVAITNATFDAAGGNLYAFDIKGGAQVTMTDVTVGGGIWCNVHLNGGSLSGSGITMVGDVVEVSADGSYYTYRGQTVTGAPPFGMDFTKVKGESVTIPFMDIVRETGAETVSLAEPLVRGASLLFVANMPGDGTQTGVTVPSPRFGCYTLDISAPISFLDGETTGWTETTWNDIIDTGSLVLEAVGEDSGTVAVELTLNEDIDLGSNEFEFRNGNLTVDGDGNALSGTIKYTDTAGLLENIVLGTEDKPLVLDMRGTGRPVEIGGGVAITNVTILMTEEQAIYGTPVFDWDVDVVGADGIPTHDIVVSVTIVDVGGNPQGEPKGVVWDDAMGMAYIGPCEARLSGNALAAPLYTTLTNAFALAADGDTVTLFMDGVTLDEKIILPEGTVMFAKGDYDLTVGASAEFSITNLLTTLRSDMDLASIITVKDGWLLDCATDGTTNIYRAAERGVYNVPVVAAGGAPAKAPISVAESWVTANVPNATTVNEVEAKLNEDDPSTGIKRWQSYVLNQTGGVKVSDVAQGSDLVSTTLADPKATAVTKFQVKYSLDRVTMDAATVTAGDIVTDKAGLVLPLNGVTTNAFYKVRVHFIADGGEGEALAETANTIGVLKVDSAEAMTIVAVPWLSFGGGTMTIAELVHTSLLEPGDELCAYDSSAGAFRGWELASGAWVPMQTAAESGLIGGKDADMMTVSRGAGVWVRRRNPASHPIYLIGEVSDVVVETPLAAADPADKYADGTMKPKWNLVAAPSVRPVTVQTILGGNTGDQAVLPTGTVPKIFTYKNGSWGYSSTEAVMEGGVKVGVRPTRNTEVTEIPAGTGFWYLNFKTDGTGKINW